MSSQILRPLLFFAWIMGLPLAASQNPFQPVEMEDQFGESHFIAPDGERILMVVLADRTGSSFIEEWVPPLAIQLQEASLLDRLRIVSVAHLRGVPFFLRGTVRRAFPKDPNMKILMDWGGQVARNQGMETDHCNLLLFDPEGNPLQHRAVQELDPASFAEVLESLTDLLTALAADPINSAQSMR